MKKSQFEPDEIDRRILRVMQQDGRVTNQQLADRVGLSPAACWRRVRAMEERGVIRKYAAILDPEAVNLKLCVMVHVTLTRHSKELTQDFIEAVKDRPEVLQCYAVTGDHDFMLRVVAPDMETFDRFLEDFIFTIPGISQVKSNIALREIKSEVSLPI